MLGQSTSLLPRLSQGRTFGATRVLLFAVVSAAGCQQAGAAVRPLPEVCTCFGLLPLLFGPSVFAPVLLQADDVFIECCCPGRQPGSASLTVDILLQDTPQTSLSSCLYVLEHQQLIASLQLVLHSPEFVDRSLLHKLGYGVRKRTRTGNSQRPCAPVGRPGDPHARGGLLSQDRTWH